MEDKKNEDAPPLRPIPDYGNHMTWDDFMENVESGGFIDYDGHGDLATKDGVSRKHVYPSMVADPSYKKPEWATHVVWYNK